MSPPYCMNAGEAVIFVGVQSGGRPAAERTNGVETIKRHLDLFFHEIAPYRYLSLK